MLHKKVDPSAKGDSLVDFLPAKSRDFVRWDMDRLEQLTKVPDKSVAAAAAEGLVYVLMITKKPEDMQTAIRNLFAPEKKDESRQKIVEYLRLAVRLDPSRERAWDMLTALLAEKGEMEEAAAVARKRLETKDNAHNRLLLAKVYADQGQFAKAAEQLRAGLKSEPKDLDCRLGLAAALLKREDASSLQMAGDELDRDEAQVKADKSRGYQTSYLLLRGLHAALDDRPAPAKKYLKQVLQLDKGNTTVWKARAALGDPVTPADEPEAVDFLKKLGCKIVRQGKEINAPVVKIVMPDSKIRDEDLFVLAAFPQLRNLDISSKTITDAGLAHLEKLKSLRRLRLYGTTITDTGLSHLKDLTNLRELDLGFTKITDNGLPHLKTLTQLRHLRLIDTKITDLGLAHLEVFQNLIDLEIGEFSLEPEKRLLKDDGLVHLRKLSRLRDLFVWSPITDKGLAHLAAVPRLQSLSIIASEITDEGVSHLERCTELQDLGLNRENHGCRPGPSEGTPKSPHPDFK